MEHVCKNSEIISKNGEDFRLLTFYRIQPQQAWIPVFYIFVRNSYQAPTWWKYG